MIITKLTNILNLIKLGKVVLYFGMEVVYILMVIGEAMNGAFAS